jgi:hypothetical protein
MGFRKPLLALVVRLSGCVLIVGVIVAMIQSPCQGAANDDAAAQVEAAITAIQHNYSQWRTIRVSLERVLINPGVSEKKVQTFQDPGGGTTTITTEPRIATLEKVVLRGTDLRYEVFNAAEDAPVQIETRLDAKVTDYHADAKMAWVRRPEEMADAGAIDPRDIGVVGGKLSLAQVLRDYATTEAKWIRMEDGSQRLQVRKKSPKGQQMILFLDPAKSMLPSLLGYVGEDGNFSWATRIDYQEVNAGAGWFPKKAMSKGFPKGQGKDFERDTAHQIETVEITKLELDGPIDDSEFQQSIPRGVKVFDNLQDKRYRVGEEPRVRSQPSSPYRVLAWASAGLVMLVSLAACLIYYFKRRRSDKPLNRI